MISSPTSEFADPLSDVISLLKPRTYVTGGLSAGEPWAIHFPAYQGVKCYSVAKGTCQLSMDGLDQPLSLQAGSSYLLPHGRPFTLASDLNLPPKNVDTIVSTRNRYNGVLTASEGETFLLLGSQFILDGDTSFLLDALPLVASLDSPSQRDSLRWAVERMMREMRDPQPGGTLIAQQVAYTLLVESLRLHLAGNHCQRPNWLFALADRGMLAALSAMHQQPARAWSLRELAQAAGMSRTAFAASFKLLVGKTPMVYLTEWRMSLAMKRLEDPKETISRLAPSLGYQSDSAFSAAFKRKWKESPRAHIRSRKKSGVRSDKA